MYMGNIRIYMFLYIRSSEQWMLKSQPFDWVEASFLFVKGRASLTLCDPTLRLLLLLAN
jgi:hypothetical protein